MDECLAAFVGFDPGDGHFQASLRKHRIDFKRVEIDSRRPYLTKFDAMLRQMLLLPSGPISQTLGMHNEIK